MVNLGLINPDCERHMRRLLKDLINVNEYNELPESTRKKIYGYCNAHRWENEYARYNAEIMECQSHIEAMEKNKEFIKKFRKKPKEKTRKSPCEICRGKNKCAYFDIKSKVCRYYGNPDE